MDDHFRLGWDAQADHGDTMTRIESRVLVVERHVVELELETDGVPRSLGVHVWVDGESAGRRRNRAGARSAKAWLATRPSCGLRDVW